MFTYLQFYYTGLFGTVYLKHSTTDSSSSFKAALKTHLCNNYFQAVFHVCAYPPVWPVCVLLVLR